MPLAKIMTSVALPTPEHRRDSMMATFSRTLAEITGKPERYVMITFEVAPVILAGKPGPAAFCDIRGIGGLSPEINAAISKEFSALLNQWQGIPLDRIYLNFSELAPTHWGFNGKTFG